MKTFWLFTTNALTSLTNNTDEIVHTDTHRTEPKRTNESVDYRASKTEGTQNIHLLFMHFDSTQIHECSKHSWCVSFT